MTYFISQIYMGVMWHSRRLSVDYYDLFYFTVYMGVMWHSGRLSVAYYDLFYFTDLHECDVELWASECGLL